MRLCVCVFSCFLWYWCFKNLCAVHKDTLHNLEVRAWYAQITYKIIGPMFFEEIVDSGCYILLILTPLFRELTEKDKICGYLMQDNAMALTVYFSVTALEQLFGRCLIYHLLWPLDFQIWICDSYLWVTLKDRVYINNPHILQEQKDDTWRGITDISRRAPLHVKKYFHNDRGKLRCRSALL